MIHDPHPHRDGDDWSYLTDDWKPAHPERKPTPVLQRKIPTWIITLVACVALIVLVVPPLAKAIAKAAT